MCCDPTDSKTKPFKKLASTINSHRGMKQQGKQPRTASAKNGAVSPQPFQPLTDQACPTQQKVRRDIFCCILQRPPLPAAGPAQLAATHQDHDRTCEALTGKADTRWQQFTASTRQGNSKGGKSPEKRVTPQKKPHNHTRKDHRQQQDTCWQHITDTHQQPWREGKTPVTAARGLVNKPRGASKGPHQQRRMHQNQYSKKPNIKGGRNSHRTKSCPRKPARHSQTDKAPAAQLCGGKAETCLQRVTGPPPTRADLSPRNKAKDKA